MKKGLFTTEINTTVRNDLRLEMNLSQKVVSSRLQFATHQVDPSITHYERFKFYNTYSDACHILLPLFEYQSSLIFYSNVGYSWSLNRKCGVLLELCSIKLQYGTYPTLVEEETFSHLIRLVPLIYSNGPSNGLSKLGLGCGVGLV